LLARGVLVGAGRGKAREDPGAIAVIAASIIAAAFCKMRSRHQHAAIVAIAAVAAAFYKMKNNINKKIYNNI